MTRNIKSDLLWTSPVEEQVRLGGAGAEQQEGKTIGEAENKMSRS